MIALVTCATCVACGEPASSEIHPEDSAEPAGAAPIASLTRAVGDVRVQAAGSAHWVSAEAGRGLGTADSVQTMSDAHATLTFLETGARTELAPHTTMVIPPQTPRTTRLRHLSGQLFARLDATDEVDRLEVAIPAGELVLDQADGGAAYVEARVEITDAHAEVAMLSGRGRLDRGDRPSIPVEEAQYVRIDQDARVVESGADVSPPEALSRPAEDALVVTRGEVSLEWTPVPGVLGYLVALERDGGTRSEREVREARAHVRVASGTYRWTVRAVTERGPGHVSAPGRFRARVDRTPPALALTSPAPSEVVQGSAASVRGRSEPGATVEINGQAATVAADGGFEARVPVPAGLTNLVIVAEDRAGNRRSITRAVLRSR